MKKMNLRIFLNLEKNQSAKRTKLSINDIQIILLCIIPTSFLALRYNRSNSIRNSISSRVFTSAEHILQAFPVL